MKTLEEYLYSKAIEESKYDFIDREFIDYFNEKWIRDHSQNYDFLLYEGKILYDGQEEQADIIDKEFQDNKGKESIIIPSIKFKGIHNVVFDKLHLYVNHVNSDEHAEYKFNDIKYSDYNDVRWNCKAEIQFC